MMKYSNNNKSCLDGLLGTDTVACRLFLEKGRSVIDFVPKRVLPQL